MKRIALMSIVLTGMLLVPTSSFAQISCTREGLQRALELYIAAQTRGDTSGMPLATGLGYMFPLSDVARSRLASTTPAP